MPHYVDAFLLPISPDRLDDYRKAAEIGAEVWKEYGALHYWECLADDLDVPDMVSFREAAKAGPNETVVIAWAVFESKEARDKANEKIMADERMKEAMDQSDPPFDFRRMVFGGFSELVHT